jgi:hypothetical protein
VGGGRRDAPQWSFSLKNAKVLPQKVPKLLMINQIKIVVCQCMVYEIESLLAFKNYALTILKHKRP